MINAYKILVRKLEGKGPVRRPKGTWENNIKMDLKEIECEPDISNSGKNLMVGSCEHSNELSGSIKGGEFLDQMNEC
jgi:hypothetical protein